MRGRQPTFLEKIKALKELSSDGCTMAPDLNFRGCCEQHDMYYSTDVINRWEADKLLRLCIKSKGYPILSWVYWIAVRMFGWVPYYFGNSAKRRKNSNTSMK